MTITVYLIHCEKPINPDHLKQPRHYIGVTNNLTRRLKQHTIGRSAKGSAFLAAANERATFLPSLQHATA